MIENAILKVCMVKLSIDISYFGYLVSTIWPMDLVFMSTFDNQSMSIGCVGKLGHLFDFLRHYLLNLVHVHSKYMELKW